MVVVASKLFGPICTVVADIIDNAHDAALLQNPLGLQSIGGGPTSRLIFRAQLILAPFSLRYLLHLLCHALCTFQADGWYASPIGLMGQDGIRQRAGGATISDQDCALFALLGVNQMFEATKMIG